MFRESGRCFSNILKLAMTSERTNNTDVSLAELASLHGTDKLAHGYIPHYERHFGPLRDRPLRILEIGLGSGGSVRMWRDYFPLGEVVGIDLAEKRSLELPRIRVYRGDQSDASFLQHVVSESGGIDVVIDDGSHVNQDVFTSFQILFPLLREGGFYVIEDVHTPYWSKVWWRLPQLE